MSSPAARTLDPRSMTGPLSRRGSAGDPASATQQPAHDVGLLLLRLMLGLVGVAHGTQKLLGWWNGPGLDGTAKSFTASGYPAGRVMAVVAGLCETLGGLGLVLGLLTPLAGSALLGTMLNAIAVKSGAGFFFPAGIEYELVLAVGAATLALTGPGRYAADRLLPVLRDHRLSHGAVAVLVGIVIAGAVLVIRG